MEILVVGSPEVVSAMALAGLPGRTVEGSKGLLPILKDIELIEDLRILVLEEQVAQLERDEVDRMKLDPSGPLVLEIPGIRGPIEGRRTPLDLVRQALGIHL